MSAISLVNAALPKKNCLNKIAHKFYAIQNAVSNLCTTDTKVYTFLIIGRFFQAFSLLAFSGSIICAIIINPILCLGTIPAVALGILGTHIAGNPQEISDALHMPRPFVLGQPIGLINSGNNCWLNSSLQLILSVPAFAARLRQLPDFAQFLNQYQAAGRNFQKVAQDIDTQTLRQSLSTATGGQISASQVQEDPADLFAFLFEGRNALYNMTQQTDDGPLMQRSEPMIGIFPGHRDPRPNFQQLFNNYFDHQTEIGQRIRLSLPSPPEGFLVQLLRFYQNGAQQEKINDPIDIPTRITYGSAQYEPSAFLIHRGETQDNGHYIAYIKQGNTWWFLSDSSVYEVSASVAMEEIKHNYICYWRKVIPVS